MEHEANVDLNIVVKDLQEKEQISQSEVARRVTMSPQNFSQALRGKRPVTEKAIIYLQELTGINAMRLLEASQRLYKSGGKKMLIALLSSALVILFLTLPEKVHAASMSYDTATSLFKDYRYRKTFCKMAQKFISNWSRHVLKVASALGFCGLLRYRQTM